MRARASLLARGWCRIRPACTPRGAGSHLRLCAYLLRLAVPPRTCDRFAEREAARIRLRRTRSRHASDAMIVSPTAQTTRTTTTIALLALPPEASMVRPPYMKWLSLDQFPRPARAPLQRDRAATWHHVASPWRA